MDPTNAYAALTGFFIATVLNVVRNNNPYTHKKKHENYVKAHNQHAIKHRHALIVAFYMNLVPTPDGDLLNDILNWPIDDARWESKHGFIQWLFPTNMPSRYQGEAPILTKDLVEIMKQTPTIFSHYAKAFELFMGYMHVDLYSGSGGSDEDKTLNIAAKQAITDRPKHNFLRLTRVLHSLRCFGFDDVAFRLYNALIGVAIENDDYKEAKRYWAGACHASDIWEITSDTPSDNIQRKLLDGISSSILRMTLENPNRKSLYKSTKGFLNSEDNDSESADNDAIYTDDNASPKNISQKQRSWWPSFSFLSRQ